MLPSTQAQVSWDGGGDPNASGKWSVDANWLNDLVPTAVPVQLNDVTSGARAVTYDVTSASVTALAMSQATAGGVNSLLVTGPSVLTLSASGAAFSQTLSGGGIQVDVNGGAVIELSATAAKSFNNFGILNLGGAGSGGGILRASGSNGALTVNNSGVIHLNDGSITRAGSTSANNSISLVINNGSASNAAAEMRFDSGTNLLGSPNVLTNGTSTTLNNYGLAVFENGGVTQLASAATSGGTSGFAFNNQAGGTMRIGGDTVAGSAVIARTGGGGSFYNFILTNSGTLGVYGQSRIVNRTTSSGNPDGFRIENPGVMNLVGDAAGVVLGFDSGANSPSAAQFNNAGTVNVQVFAGEASGRTTFGTVGTGNSQRGSANLANSGAFNINPNAAFIMQGRGGPTNQNVTFTNNSNATLTLGVAASSDTGGSLQFNMTQYGGTPTGTAVGPTFTNNGTTVLHGTSRIELLSTSASTADGNKFNVTNTAGANLSLRESAGLGNTSKRVILANAGTITRLGSGISGILGAGGSTYTNTGAIDIQGGTLVLSGALDNSGVLKGGGTLGAGGYNGLAGGSVEPGNGGVGTLTLSMSNTTDAASFASGATFRFDLAAPGTSDVLAFTGLGASGSSVVFNANAISFSNAGGLASGLYTLFTFDQPNAYSGALSIGSGLEAFGGSAFIYGPTSIQLSVDVVPEPGSGMLAGTAAIGLLARRRRQVRRASV